ncbi:hypothetical protein J3F83DRAFT_599555 [Trichoderma novae-zelandiae]
MLPIWDSHIYGLTRVASTRPAAQSCPRPSVPCISGVRRPKSASPFSRTSLPRMNHQNTDPKFDQRRRFSRGWTLQELIAPLELLFYSKDWNLIDAA